MGRADLFGCLISLSSVCALAQAPSPSVHLVYGDSALSQQDRTRLIEVLSSQPLRYWDRVGVTSSDVGYYKLIEHNYNLSSLTNPEAVGKLIDAIKAANPEARETLKAGSTLLIPPVPRRVYTTNDKVKAPLRISPSGTREILEATSLADVGIDGAHPPPPLKDPRDGDLTAKELGDPGAIAEKAWADPEHPILPRNVHAFDEDEVVHIRLLGGQDCNSSEDWLASSPLLSNMRLRLQAITSNTTQLQSIQQRATETPFVVIDWNSSDEEHEKKVRSVAEYVFHELGISLPVIEVDLNPFYNKQNLRDLLSEFAGTYYCPKMGLDCKKKEPQELKDAKTWLEQKHTATEKIATVNQLVVEAVLWQYFQKQRAWVNMSFSIDSRALEIMQADFLSSSRSFGVSAANDDRFPESPVGIPQRAASVYPNFINVSYGSLAGQLLGGYSNPLYSVIVTTMGQGCGFQFGNITKVDAGTSFASPYVGAASWIKFLIDGVDEKHMRRSIIESSNVTSGESTLLIESAGQFDMARLLIKPISTISYTDGSVTESSNVTLRLRFKDSNGLEAEKNFKSGIGAAVSFRSVNGSSHARIRTFRESPPFIPSTDLLDCEVLSAEVNLNGAARDISGSPSIRSIVF